MRECPGRPALGDVPGLLIGILEPLCIRDIFGTNNGASAQLFELIHVLAQHGQQALSFLTQQLIHLDGATAVFVGALESLRQRDDLLLGREADEAAGVDPQRVECLFHGGIFG